MKGIIFAKLQVAVRYAWKNDPMVNLFGKNGLPAGRFRTDEFELTKTSAR